MPSTFSSNLRVELMASGEQSTVWGQKTNTNLELLEAAISEMATIATTGGTTVLTALDGADDQARKAVLKITGTLVSNATLQIPAVSKWYLVWNATSGAYTVTIKTAAGSGQTVTANQVRLVYCDGTDVFNLVANSVSGGTVGGTASALTYDLASSTLTGTLAQFNTACSDADFASLAGAESLTNKTMGSGCTWSGNTVSLAVKSSTLAQNGGSGAAMTFQWSAQGGQPAWLWGSNDGSTHQVYNPSNFSVNYATTAGTASVVADGAVSTTAKLANNVVTAAKLGADEQKRIAKAWVNFDGTLSGTIAPRASYNVASVTKNTGADYTINFTSALANANYSLGGMSLVDRYIGVQSTAAQLTTSVRVITRNGAGTSFDVPLICVQVFGD